MNKTLADIVTFKDIHRYNYRGDEVSIYPGEELIVLDQIDTDIRFLYKFDDIKEISGWVDISEIEILI